MLLGGAVCKIDPGTITPVWVDLKRYHAPNTLLTILISSLRGQLFASSSSLAAQDYRSMILFRED